MRFLVLLITAVLSAIAFSDVANAQAGTGGTNDRPGPTMVFPIRPRDEPPTVTAVPNRAYQYYPQAPVRVMPIRPAFRYRKYR